MRGQLSISLFPPMWPSKWWAWASWMHDGMRMSDSLHDGWHPPGRIGSKPRGLSWKVFYILPSEVSKVQFFFGKVGHWAQLKWKNGEFDPYLSWEEVSKDLWKWKSFSHVHDSLWPHGLYSLRDSPGRNTGGIAIPFPRGSSQPRDWTQGSHIAGRFFTI